MIIDDIQIQQLLLSYLSPIPIFEDRVREFRKENGLDIDRNKLVDQEKLFAEMAKVAKSKGVFGDRAPLQDVIQYADMTNGKRPPRPKPSTEDLKEMKKQPCEAFKQGRCKWGEKCYRKHGKKGESKESEPKGTKCPYCLKEGHRLGGCKKIKRDEAEGKTPPSHWKEDPPEKGGEGKEKWKEKKKGKGKSSGYTPPEEALHVSEYILFLPEYDHLPQSSTFHQPSVVSAFQDDILMLGDGNQDDPPDQSRISGKVSSVEHSPFFLWGKFFRIDSAKSSISDWKSLRSRFL